MSKTNRSLKNTVFIGWIKLLYLLTNLFSAESWTCLICLLSQCVRNNIISSSFCSFRLILLNVSKPCNLVSTISWSSSGNVSNCLNIIVWILCSLRSENIYCQYLKCNINILNILSISEHNLWNHTIGQCSQDTITCFSFFNASFALLIAKFIAK